MESVYVKIINKQNLNEKTLKEEVLLAETRMNEKSLLRFHIYEDAWLPVDHEGNPPAGIEVLGFNKEWIDEDFNPNGSRVCWRDEEGVWTSACWCNTMDSWQTLKSNSDNTEYSPYNDNNADAPTHFMYKPKPPRL